MKIKFILLCLVVMGLCACAQPYPKTVWDINGCAYNLIGYSNTDKLYLSDFTTNGNSRVDVTRNISQDKPTCHVDNPQH